jgi:Fe-S-cluster containining protein
LGDDQQPYDCQACGACCVHLGGYDGNGYVYLDRQEAVRMRRLGLPVVEQALGSKCLAAAPHDGAWGYPACVAFEGDVGGRCGCSVYADRPSVCREFSSGSDVCREARDRAGLPV